MERGPTVHLSTRSTGLDLAPRGRLYAGFMQRNGLLIGEVAALSGLSRKALRLYEARGILLPPRREPSGYRRYPGDVLPLLSFVGQARRLGLTLSEIKHIVALRRSGSAPCVHVRALLEQKAADLEAMLAGVRSILGSWRSTNGRHAAVCPHIEAKGGDRQWKGSRSARSASPARKSSSTAIPSASARTRTSSSSRKRNGTSSSRRFSPANLAGYRDGRRRVWLAPRRLHPTET